MQTLILYAGLLLSPLFFSPSADAAAAWAEVKFLKGKATAGVESLKVGSKIALGDVITTGKQSFVRILIPGEGAAMQVGPESTVRLTKRDPAITRVDLVKGFVLSTVKPLKTPGTKSRFQVHSKNVALGVRGTTFFVKENDDGRSFICVCDGTVNARWVKGGEEIKSKHHDAPKWIVDGAAKPVAAPMGDEHTDAEIEELKKLL